MNIVVPMAGRGERFLSSGYGVPKPLIKIMDRTMIEWSLTTLDICPLSNKFIFIVRDYGDEKFNNELDLILNKFCPDCSIIKIDHITDGPARSCLVAKKEINNDDPLVICNCDQVMRWNGSYFLNSCINSCYDGIVVTYDSDTPKNSYAKIDANGNVVKIEEKNVISKISLNGIHFWKKGKYFVESSEEMIKKKDMYNNEFYVAPSYNYMIKGGKKIGIFHIAGEQHWPTGVPEDLKKFINFFNIYS